MKFLAPLVLVAALGACALPDAEAQAQREALIRAFCAVDEESAWADYLESRDGAVAGLPDFGPEKDLYCAIRIPMLGG